MILQMIEQIMIVKKIKRKKLFYKKILIFLMN